MFKRALLYLGGFCFMGLIVRFWLYIYFGGIYKIAFTFFLLLFFLEDLSYTIAWIGSFC